MVIPMPAEWILVLVAFTVANLIIVGLNLKLYTEVFKENAQRYRSGRPSGGDSQ